MKIKMNEGKINHENNTIVCGKTFMKNASKYGTPEYNEFIGMKRDCPNYKVVVIGPRKAEAKMSTKGLTRERMELHITTRFGMNSDEHKEFLNQKRISETYTNPYMSMRKWFVEKYPNWDGKEAEREQLRQKKAMARIENAKNAIAKIDKTIAKAEEVSASPIKKVC